MRVSPGKNKFFTINLATSKNSTGTKKAEVIS
jgi:hypothetical protein